VSERRGAGRRGAPARRRPLAGAPPASPLATLRRCLDDGRPVAVATVVRGATLGAKLLVFPDGRAEGDLGDPELAARVAADAVALLAEGRSELRAYRSSGQPATADEPVELFLDSYAPAPTLIVVGATHTGVALSRIARVLGFRVRVVDARGAWATAERFPDVDEIVTRWPDEALREIGLDRSSFVVVLTHEPRFDVPALKVALATEARYVGAIGSRRTHADRVRRLREQGVDDAALARIRAPIGLDLGGQTPEEIALGIAAEMVAVRYGRELAPVASGAFAAEAPPA
jgi:xanthine dehydrogenase accessory factor